VTALLHHDVLSAPGSSPTRSLFFLHGILGQGTNWRGFARQLVKQRPDWSAVLVDLRAHGDSRAVAGRDDLRGAAEDVTRLRDSLRLPVHGVLGHSFGGKVALRWMHDDPGALCRAFIVDSLPGARPDQTGSEGTMRVVEMLDALPPRFDSRDAFVAHVVEQGHSKALAAWLGQSLDRLEDGVRFGLDVGVGFASGDHPSGQAEIWVLTAGLLAAVRVEVASWLALSPGVRLDIGYATLTGRPTEGSTRRGQGASLALVGTVRAALAASDRFAVFGDVDLGASLVGHRGLAGPEPVVGTTGLALALRLGVALSL